MTDGTVLVEKLLNYAKENLELPEEDVYVKRNLLLHVLGLKSTDIPEVVDTPTLKSLKKELNNYASENSLEDKNAPKFFASFVMGILLPLPSVIDKKFRSLREKFGAKAACNYLYNLSVKGGSVSDKTFESSANAYFSTDGAEIYISDINEENTASLKEYPKCQYCVESEGYYGENSHGNGAGRSVPLILESKEWKMRYVDQLTRPEECKICSVKHVKTDITESLLVAMLDFIEYIPEYSAGVSDFPSASDHLYFTAGIFNPPVHRAKPTFVASSEKYPDVEITVYSNAVNVIRLRSFNRNTIERLSIDILNRWKTYNDPEMEISYKDTDGKCVNSISLSTRFSSDNRYSVDIILSTNKSGVRPGAAKNMFDDVINAVGLFGRFILDKSFIAVSDTISSVLMKKIPVDGLFNEGSSLYGYRELTEYIINEYGYTKDAQKTENAIKQGVYKQLLSAVARIAAFPGGEQGIRAFRRFLASVEVRS